LHYVTKTCDNVTIFEKNASKKGMMSPPEYEAADAGRARAAQTQRFVEGDRNILKFFLEKLFKSY